jgi:SagB-type dehydrogenase family enzyme
MSYAAQLKNVGVIYQTLYLVATAMNIGACGLGTGNADRFARLTGLPYLEEGSIGEFMLGRPLQ